MESYPFKPTWPGDMDDGRPRCYYCGKVIKNPGYYIAVKPGDIAVDDASAAPQYDIGTECRKNLPSSFIFHD